MAQLCFLVSRMFMAANAICKLTKAQVFSGISSFVSLIIAKMTKARSHKNGEKNQHLATEQTL